MVRPSAVSLSLLAAAIAPAACAAPPADTVTPADLRARIAVLADDDFAGRKPGTPGGAKTEAYIADAFARAGLVPGAADGGWRQPVELVEPMPPPSAGRRFQAANIIGKVAGNDPAQGAIVLTAHWDHLGVCRPAGTPDRICNGANDNASGVAMLIETARRIATGPRPSRDVYFVATTAEEMGELGAAAFVAAPPVPIGRFVAGLNLDTAVIAPAGMPVAMIGRGRAPALDAVIDRTARSLGRTIDSDNEADVMIQRQDGWKLAQAGVPAVMVSGSFSDMKRLMAYLAGVYHRPGDDMAHLGDLSGAAEDATLHVALARALADPATYPASIR